MELNTENNAINGNKNSPLNRSDAAKLGWENARKRGYVPRRPHDPSQPRRLMDSLTTVEIEKFWARVKKVDNGCWEWTGAKLHGVDVNGKLRTTRFGLYGYFAVGDISRKNRQTHFYAHRVAWTLRFGLPPQDMTLDHLCFNKSCCNPDHLRLLTRAENSRVGNPLANRPGRKLLQYAKLKEVSELVASGMTKKSACELVGISETTYRKRKSEVLR
jgi:hypothetical protein